MSEKDAFCGKHKIWFNSALWCPMCLEDEMEQYDEQHHYEQELEQHQPREEVKANG